MKVKRNIFSQAVVLFFLVYVSEKRRLLNKMFIARKGGLSPTSFSAETKKKVSVDNHTSKPSWKSLINYKQDLAISMESWNEVLFLFVWFLFNFFRIRALAPHPSTSQRWFITKQCHQNKNGSDSMSGCYREWKLFGNYGWKDLTMWMSSLINFRNRCFQDIVVTS